LTQIKRAGPFELQTPFAAAGKIAPMKTVLIALSLALTLCACSRDDGKGGGPMEKAGRNMQDAAKGK
jgi:hypothetical protein